jgi:capsular polysaccharide transport system permease protein
MIVLLAGVKLFGFRIAPHDPLLILFALTLLGFCGLGFGLVFSTISGLLPEFARAGRLLFQALYILSAVIYPVFIIPQPYRDVMMLNPLVHGIESVRAGFFSTYRLVPEVSLTYLAGFAVFSVFIGLLLQVRFQQRLLAR